MSNEILASILAVAHTIAASAVTLHVLLTHREVRSSFGWIGLAWLSPFVGSTIYVFFGINRVARRGSKLNWHAVEHNGVETNAHVLLQHADEAGTLSPDTLTTNLLSIAEAGDRITGSSLTACNDIHFFENGDMAYPEMVATINKAQRSVALASYIFADDAGGAAFVDALIAAHERGVVVRVLTDGVGSGYFRSMAHERLTRAGVKSAQFLHEWLPWKMSFINLRNHKKILVVDGRVGFTGGMNIAKENVGNGQIPEVQDVHARVEGPIVAHLLLTFARDWDFVTHEPLTGAEWWPQLESTGLTAMRGVSSGPDQPIGHIEQVWATAIEQAKTSIRIYTPYFLPEDHVLELLSRAALRGVNVDIIVPEKTNHFYMDWAFRAHVSALPLDLINCYLVVGAFDHSKLMSVDGVWCALGSPNWDARSMRLNFEFMVECYCASAAGAVDAIIDKKMGNARRLDFTQLNERSFVHKLRDATARLFLPYL